MLCWYKWCGTCMYNLPAYWCVLTTYYIDMNLCCAWSSMPDSRHIYVSKNLALCTTIAHIQCQYESVPVYDYHTHIQCRYKSVSVYDLHAIWSLL